MKTVFENRMVAHIWAQQNQSEGRSSNSQFYFKDKTIFSYRDTWPLATFIKDNEVLLNTERISVTTSKHLGYVRQALNHDAKIWHVDCNIIKNPDAFTSKLAVYLDDNEIASDHLGGSVYAAKNVSEFWTSHRDADFMNRNCQPMRDARGQNVMIGHYFPDMVRTACDQAREWINRYPEMRKSA